MVESRLPKPLVAGSIPVSRSKFRYESNDDGCRGDFAWGYQMRAIVQALFLLGQQDTPALPDPFVASRQLITYRSNRGQVRQQG